MTIEDATMDAKNVAGPTVFHQPAASSRFSGRRAMLAVVIAVAVVLVAIVYAGMALTDAATATDFTARNLAPSIGHPFGTDSQPRSWLACLLLVLLR